MVNNLPANAGDTSSVSELGRSHGERNGNPLQYTCPGNLIDRGAWWATVHGATKSWQILAVVGGLAAHEHVPVAQDLSLAQTPVLRGSEVRGLAMDPIWEAPP